MTFTKPQIEIIHFDACDVIATSTVTYGSAKEALAEYFGGSFTGNEHAFDCPTFGDGGSTYSIGQYTFEKKGKKWHISNS